MRIRLAALVLAAGALACAGAPRRELSDAELLDAGPHELSRAGWDRLLRNQAAGAAPLFARAVAADRSEPWALFGQAVLARRALDGEGEAEALLLLLERAPGHGLGAIAARRLGELAERSPALATAAAGRLGALLHAGKLNGHTASRARSARAHALDALGEGEEASRARREWGAVGAWTLSGPWSPYHQLDFRRPFAPEEGALPAATPGLPGLAPVPARALAVGDGVVGLEGEPAARGDVYYLAADLALSRGGEYLAAVGGTGALRAWLDGEPLAERDPGQGPAPASQVAMVRLGPGTHRLLLKVVRGGGPGARFAASLARADGAPCDLAVSPAPVGASSAAVKGGAPLPPALRAADLAARLEREGGPAVARLAVARDAVENDREAAKALLDEALASYPASALLLEARAEAHAEDGTLGERTARGRAEALLDRALAADATASSARLARAELMRAGDRLDDARALLEALPAADAARPAARLLRARIAMGRGHADGAEREAEAAFRESGACGAAELLLDLARRRDAVARADDLARSLARCPGGRERLAQHLRSRGDAAGAVELARSLARAAPARLDRRLELTRALLAAGQPAAAASELGELESLWPRDPRLPRRRAELLERAGDLEGARRERERSLLLDGSDLALRRALALEQGREPLDDLAEDGRKALAGYRAAAPREEATAVYVLDHGAVEANPDGSYLERVHQVVSLADQRAVDRFAEVQVPAGGELLLARTLKRDGRVLEAEERGEKGTVSLPGVEPGDAAEWAWLRAVPARGPAVPGFTADAFFFRGDIPMWRTAYAAAAPSSTGLQVESRRQEPPAVREEGKRQVMRAGAEQVPALVPEPGAPTEAEFLPMVRVGNGAGPEAVPLALADSLAEASRPSLEIARLAREIERSVPEAGRGGEPLLRAAWARVAGLVQGQGASLADQASQVLARGTGSRLLLLQSVLRVLGIRARVAVARDFARDPAASAFPRFDEYPFPLLHVEHGGRTWWVDPSAREIPFGSLSPTLAGAPALVLPLPGEEPRRAQLPPADPADARTVALQVDLRAGGAAAVEGVEEYRGYEAGAYRSSLARVDANQRRQVVEQALARSFRGATLETLTFEGEPDLDAPLRVRWRILAPSWARAEDGKLVAEVPIQPPRLAARYAQRGNRETPLLISSPEELLSRIEVQVPPGVRPLPAPPVERTGPHGSYRREEKVEGGKLVRTDRYRLERGRIAPADFPAFLAFAMGVDGAHAAPMVFSSSSPGVAADPRIDSGKPAISLGGASWPGGHAP